MMPEIEKVRQAAKDVALHGPVDYAAEAMALARLVLAWDKQNLLEWAYRDALLRKPLDECAHEIEESK